MPRKSSVFEQMLDAMTKTGDATLRWYFRKREILDSISNTKEYNALVETVADKVISRIHVTVDAQEVFDAIDGLNEKIESLGR